MKKMNFSTALNRILQAPVAEAIKISQDVDDRLRARLAVYCYVRNHLRDKGLLIASICRMKDLAAESSPYVAENIFSLAAHVTEGPLVQQQRRLISLAVV